MSRFPLGRLVATPGVLAAISHEQLHALVASHSAGDWGVVAFEDKVANEHALRDGARILSAYVVGNVRIYVITEADRSSTCVLLCEEY